MYDEDLFFGVEHLGKTTNDESKLYEKLVKEYNDYWRPMIKSLVV